MRYSFDLRFVRGGQPSLDSTCLSEGNTTRLAVRGKTGGAHRTPYTFQWTGGVQAFALLFVATAAAGKTVILSGGAETVLRSFDFALSKPRRHQWVLDVLGTGHGGIPLATKIIKRSSPEGRKGGIVHLSLEPSLLSPDRIRVFADDLLLKGEELDKFLGELFVLYGDSISVREAPEESISPPVGDLAQDENPQVGQVREIAFISSAVEGKPFYSEVLERVVLGAARIRYPQYRVVPLLPTKSFDSLELWSLLQHAGETADGVIFIPDDPDTHHNDIVHFTAKNRKPLVLFDVNLSRKAGDGLSALPPFVGGDEIQGGRLAAQLLIGHLAAAHVSRPNILLLKATSVDWENKRASAFEETLRSRLPGARFRNLEGLQYERQQAREQCLRVFCLGERVCGIDAIFACNDDMALGARGAIIQAKRLGVNFPEHITVIGYDGIREMKDYIDNHDPYILGTVDVRIEQQVTTCLQVLQRLFEGRSEILGTQTLIQPRLYSARRIDEAIHSA